jgi:hypothetical protein
MQVRSVFGAVRSFLTKAEGHELDRKTETERDDRTQVVSGGSEEVVG